MSVSCPRFIAAGATGLLLLFGAVPLHAHRESESHLKLSMDDRTVAGQWDIAGQWEIALRDLDHVLGLDADGDGAITWGEVRVRHDEIAAFALAHLTLESGGARCDPEIREHLIDHHADEAFAVLRFVARCRDSSSSPRVTYRLFFDVDPRHRGLLRFTRDGETEVAVLSPERDTWQHAGQSVAVQGFRDFLIEGVWHIWHGFDHLLFLVSLLLPAVLRPEKHGWTAVPSFRPALLDVTKVVTAFTVAHSVTLALAALGFIHVPTRWAETAIAASVVLAALNNLRPVVRSHVWVAAFLFGLVHGIGFASALGELGLPSEGLIRSLFAFNLGVELGQLAIVCVFLPLAYWARRTWSYRVLTLRMGSALIAVVACVWLIERSAGIRLS